MVGLSLLRRIEARAATGRLLSVSIELHPELADALQNERRQELAALEREFDIRIEVIAASGLHRSEEHIEWVKREERRSFSETPTTQAAVSAADLADGVSSKSSKEDTLPAPEVSETEDAPAQDGAPKSSRRRRRGGRRRKKTVLRDQSETPSEEESIAAPQAEEPPAPEEPTTETKDPEAESGEKKKPRRRRRPRRSKKAKTENGGNEAGPQDTPKKETGPADDTKKEPSLIDKAPPGGDPFAY